MTVDATTQFLEDSMGNFTRPAGGGGSTPVTTTIAGINALATAGALAVGTPYVVTDWVSGTGSLPGPNVLWVEADDASTPSKFVRIETPLGILGPSNGEFVWNYSGSLNFMTKVTDNLGNEVHDLLSTNVDSFVWGSLNWIGNLISGGATFEQPYAVNKAAEVAGFTFNNNEIRGTGNIDLTGCTGGTIAQTAVAASAGLNVASGAAPVTVLGSLVDSGALLTVPTGGAATSCHVSAGASINTGAFAATSVVVAGAITQTLTADNTNTYAGFGLNTLI